jgi:hypothetical protein
MNVRPVFSFRDKYVWISIDADSIRNFHRNKDAMYPHKFIRLFSDAVDCGKLLGVDLVEWRGENCINDPPVGMEVLLAVLNILIGKHTEELESHSRSNSDD